MNITGQIEERSTRTIQKCKFLYLALKLKKRAHEAQNSLDSLARNYVATEEREGIERTVREGEQVDAT